MEELIWKFIDNNCTEEEVQKVEHLLANDTSFENMYQEIMRLDGLLKHQSLSEMSLDFKIKLAQKIEKQVSKLPVYTEIVSIKWWIILTIIAVFIIVLAFKLPSQNSILPEMNFQLDERSLAIATWSMAGFLCLFLFDYLLKNKTNIKRQSYFLS